MTENTVELKSGSRHRLLAPRVAFVIGSDGPAGPNASPISNLMQLSWKPAYVAVAIWHEWTTNTNLQSARGFTVSVPTVDQCDVIWRLGNKYSGFVVPKKQRKIDASGGDWDLDYSEFGPVLRGSVGWLECEIVDKQQIGASDHTLFVGEICRASGDATIVDSDGQYKRNPRVLSQVTGNLFSSAGDFFSLPWLHKD
ncbi:flavin reductase family protein [Thalassococcus sp. BH17M4-6]|uniref:flavin reductase family protein n=1 Tax=Thalassococcus sp. BH17M4-6 TaxID=3413148 RepID=UPI003BCE9DEC